MDRTKEEAEKNNRASPMDGAEEDDDVGSQLCDDVMGSIQARLPLASLVRSRAVCKSWDTTMSSAWLLKERLEVRAGGPRERMLCILALPADSTDDRMACCVYNPASDCWYQVQLDQLPYPWLHGVNEVVVAPRGSASVGVLLSTMHTQQAGERVDVVTPYMCNPVAGSWTRLPALSGDLNIEHVLGVFVDATASRFKLVALHETRKRAQQRDRDKIIPTFVFNSAVGSWSNTTSTLPRGKFFDRFCGPGVFVGTVLYCIGRRVSPRCNLLAYDMERANWNLLLVARPPDFLIEEAHLINVRDRLLCVAERWNDVDYGAPPHPNFLSMHILELDLAGMRWTTVADMPVSMYNNDLPSETRGFVLCDMHFKVVAGQDLEIYITFEALDKIVAVDLRHMPAVWRFLPSCPYQQMHGARKSVHCLDPWLEFGSWKQNV